MVVVARVPALRRCKPIHMEQYPQPVKLLLVVAPVELEAVGEQLLMEQPVVPV